MEKCLREFLREGGPRVSIPTEVLLQYATMANGALAKLKNEPNRRREVRAAVLPVTARATRSYVSGKPVWKRRKRFAR